MAMTNPKALTPLRKGGSVKSHPNKLTGLRPSVADPYRTMNDYAKATPMANPVSPLIPPATTDEQGPA